MTWNPPYREEPENKNNKERDSEREKYREKEGEKEIKSAGEKAHNLTDSIYKS